MDYLTSSRWQWSVSEWQSPLTIRPLRSGPAAGGTGPLVSLLLSLELKNLKCKIVNCQAAWTHNMTRVYWFACITLIMTVSSGARERSDCIQQTRFLLLSKLALWSTTLRSTASSSLVVGYLADVAFLTPPLRICNPHTEILRLNDRCIQP